MDELAHLAEHPLELLERPPRRDRHDELAFVHQRLHDRLHHRFHLVWLDRHDDHVGGRGDLDRIMHGARADRLGAGYELVIMRGARHDLVGADRARFDEAACDRLPHIAKADESDGR